MSEDLDKILRQVSTCFSKTYALYESDKIKMKQKIVLNENV